MDYKEHWRARLQELWGATNSTQAWFADQIGVSADYFARLLYPPGKAGKKSLGPVTIRKIAARFDLATDWFDQPVGYSVPVLAQSPDPSRHEVREPSPNSAAWKKPLVDWPFRLVSYQRVQRVRDHFKDQGIDPIGEIDKHLDILVARWENEITTDKSAAA